MESQIICSSCAQQYRDDNLPRLLIGCGHTFCQNCLINFIYQDQQSGVLHTRCPQDGIQMEIKQRTVAKFPKNLALIRVIQAKKDSMGFKENQINVSKITKNSEVHEEQDTTELISIMTGNKNDSSPQNQKDKSASRQKSSEKPRKSRSRRQKRQQICSLHKKPLDIVCIVDLKKICASCAIFGQHRTHTFKSLQQVSLIQSQYCEQITQIINQKQKISKQICCTQTKNDVLAILNTKKNKLKNRIMEEFQKLQAKVASKKKQIIKKLDQIVKKQQINLKNCMKFDDDLIKDYQQWYKKSSSHLKILQQSDFQSKLILLFEGKNIDGDIIQEGTNIIQQMKVSQQSILTEVQKKLQNLNMSVNEGINAQLDNFIHISCQDTQRKTTKITKNQPQILNQNHIPVLTINSMNMNHSQRPSFAVKYDPLQKEKRKDYTSRYNSKQNSYLQASENVNNALDQSLLQNDQQSRNQPDQPFVDQFTLRMSTIGPAPSLMNFTSAPLTQRPSIMPNIDNTIQKTTQSKMKTTIKPGTNENQIRVDKLNKKKLKMMKLPQRYEKIVDSFIADSLQILDLTNAEIGDSNMSLICQSLHGSKVRTLKLIRNKLTDQGINKILPYMGQITTLNLSQNLLSDNILDILFQNKKYLGSLKTVILSQNKITQRKNKGKIQKLKKLEWNVSI